MKAESTVRTLFGKLKADFDVKTMTSNILIKIGDHLRTKTSTPREALSFYDEVIRRDDKGHLFDALIGRADILGGSPTPKDKEKAIADFKKIMDAIEAKKTAGDKLNKDDRRQLETAMFRITELKFQIKDYKGALEMGRRFLDPKDGFPRSQFNGPMVYLYMGLSYEKLGMVDDALKKYIILSSGSAQGTISASAPAVKHLMELMWQRNKPQSGDTMSDRQGAYEYGHSYIEGTKTIKDKMSSDDLKLWLEVEQLVKQYEANPQVKPIRK